MKGIRTNIIDEFWKIWLHWKDFKLEYIQQYYLYLTKDTQKKYYIQFETEEQRLIRLKKLKDEIQTAKDEEIKNQYYWKPFTYKKNDDF